MSQAYTSASSQAPGTGLLTTTTSSTMTTPPVEQGGGVLVWGTGEGLNGSGVMTPINTSGISSSELNYKTKISTGGNTASGSDAFDLYGELQNFIGLLVRTTTGSATTCGLSGSSYNNTGTAASGVAIVVTPRAIMFRLQQMLNAMLSQPNA